MSTTQAYELQRLPTPARPTAASMTHAQSMPNRNAIFTYTGLYTSRTSQFHPGLLSRAQPEPTPSFLHKLNSAYTAIGLALTLVLTFITYRLSVISWQLSQWTAQKDFHELCLELKQASLPLTKNCNIALVEGLTPPPTFMLKRWLDHLKSTIASTRFSTTAQYYAIRNASEATPTNKPDFRFAELLEITGKLAKSEKSFFNDEIDAPCGSNLPSYSSPYMLVDTAPSRVEQVSNLMIGVIFILCFAILYRKWIKYTSTHHIRHLTCNQEASISSPEEKSLPPGKIEDEGIIASWRFFLGYDNTDSQLRKRKVRNMS